MAGPWHALNQKLNVVKGQGHRVIKCARGVGMHVEMTACSQFTPPDTTQRDCRDKLRIIISNVFRLPQTVTDSIHTARRESTPPSCSVTSGGCV